MERTKLDYRRETQDLIENNKFKASFIIGKLGISINTFYRWKRGETSPTKFQFEALKNLAESKPNQTMEGSKVNTREIQLAMEVGTLRERVKWLEEELKKKPGQSHIKT